MSTPEEESGFLSRWSRRKRAIERGEAVPEAPPAEAVALETRPASEPVVQAEAEFDLASLPPVETLDASSDFSVFLKPGVPSALKNAALRKAWVTDPLIRDFVGPLECAWDFNTPGGLPLGFSDTLAETGEALRKLLFQAIGAVEPEEEKEEEQPVAEAAELEASPPEELPAPEEAIRLSEAPLPQPAPSIPEPEPAPLRRHGGAMPN